jgi:hypothetical protein
MSGINVDKGAPPSVTTTRQTGCKPRSGQHRKQLVSKFEGRCPELKWFTFDCVEGRYADSYNMSMKEMALYVCRTFTYRADLKWKIENEEIFTFPKPSISKLSALQTSAYGKSASTSTRNAT